MDAIEAEQLSGTQLLFVTQQLLDVACKLDMSNEVGRKALSQCVR